MLIAALSDDPLDAVWLIIAFTGAAAARGPPRRAQRVRLGALQLNLPLLVIFALLLGGEIAGFIGAFIALPLAAIVRETVVYTYRHIRFQRWDLPTVGEPPPPRRCAVSGVRSTGPARRHRNASCGTELGDSDEEITATATAPG